MQFINLVYNDEHVQLDAGNMNIANVFLFQGGEGRCHMLYIVLFLRRGAVCQCAKHPNFLLGRFLLGQLLLGRLVAK